MKFHNQIKDYMRKAKPISALERAISGRSMVDFKSIIESKDESKDPRIYSKKTNNTLKLLNKILRSAEK